MKDHSTDIIAHLTSGAKFSSIYNARGGYEGFMRSPDHRTFIYGKRGELKSTVRRNIDINDIINS